MGFQVEHSKPLGECRIRTAASRQSPVRRAVRRFRERFRRLYGRSLPLLPFFPCSMNPAPSISWSTQARMLQSRQHGKILIRNILQTRPKSVCAHSPRRFIKSKRWLLSRLRQIQ
ncbi:unnamed protein product, partial [Heterosigma akashiwo]